MELFQQLNDEGVTIIMITHNEEIAEWAKRIIYIFDGEIVRERKPGEEEE
jgi:putative ABC transport system ATP-binding protein